MVITAGIDVGSGSIKAALFRSDGDTTEWIARRCERIRRRDPYKLTEQTYDETLADAGLLRQDVDYCATTGEGESITFAIRR